MRPNIAEKAQASKQDTLIFYCPFSFSFFRRTGRIRRLPNSRGSSRVVLGSLTGRVGSGHVRGQGVSNLMGRDRSGRVRPTREQSNPILREEKKNVLFFLLVSRKASNSRWFISQIDSAFTTSSLQTRFHATIEFQPVCPPCLA